MTRSDEAGPPSPADRRRRHAVDSRRAARIGGGAWFPCPTRLHDACEKADCPPPRTGGGRRGAWARAIRVGWPRLRHGTRGTSRGGGGGREARGRGTRGQRGGAGRGGGEGESAAAASRPPPRQAREAPRTYRRNGRARRGRRAALRASSGPSSHPSAATTHTAPARCPPSAPDSLPHHSVTPPPLLPRQLLIPESECHCLSRNRNVIVRHGRMSNPSTKINFSRKISILSKARGSTC